MSERQDCTSAKSARRKQLSGGLYLLLPQMETVCWDPPYLIHSFLVLGRLPDLVFHAVLNFYTTMSYNGFPISFLGSSLSRSHRHVRFVQKTVSSPLLVWMCANKSGRSAVVFRALLYRFAVFPINWLCIKLLLGGPVILHQ